MCFKVFLWLQSKIYFAEFAYFAQLNFSNILKSQFTILLQLESALVCMCVSDAFQTFFQAQTSLALSPPIFPVNIRASLKPQGSSDGVKNLWAMAQILTSFLIVISPSSFYHRQWLYKSSSWYLKQKLLLCKLKELGGKQSFFHMILLYINCNYLNFLQVLLRCI